MTIKKIMLLASATMVLVAFAAPATANAAQWTTNGTVVGNVANKDSVTLDGFLTMTAPGIVMGECEVHAETELWNEGGVGTGTVTGFEIVAPAEGCHATFAGGLVTCPFQVVGPLGLPWHVDTGTYEETTNVNITEAGFFSNFGTGCPLGLFGAAGNTTGSFNNAFNCIEFEEDGDLQVIGNETPITLDGAICDTTGALELD